MIKQYISALDYFCCQRVHSNSRFCAYFYVRCCYNNNAHILFCLFVLQVWTEQQI